MVAVPPETPRTDPIALTEAVVAEDVLQTPPGVVLVNTVDAATQTLSAPPMAAGVDGGVETVNRAVSLLEPQLFVTV